MGDHQRLKNLHNISESHEKSFYGTIRDSGKTHAQAFAKMTSEYFSIACQNRVRHHLQGIRLNYIMEINSCGKSEGLTKVRSTIKKFLPQGPKSYRSQHAKVEYLYDAATGFEWGESALTQCYTHGQPWSFYDHYNALRAAWLQEKGQNK